MYFLLMGNLFLLVREVTPLLRSIYQKTVGGLSKAWPSLSKVLVGLSIKP
jgi:hypothetical protein